MWKILLLFALAGTPALARTWTSADGTKTFEGDFRSFDAASGKELWNFAYTTDYVDSFGFDNGPRAAPTIAVGKVIVHGADGMVHAIDLKTGAASGAAAGGDVAGKLAAQKIGSKLAKTLVKLSGRSYKRYQLEKAPEYYIAYFSASW